MNGQHRTSMNGSTISSLSSNATRASVSQSDNDDQYFSLGFEEALSQWMKQIKEKADNIDRDTFSKMKSVTETIEHARTLEGMMNKNKSKGDYAAYLLYMYLYINLNVRFKLFKLSNKEYYDEPKRIAKILDSITTTRVNEAKEGLANQLKSQREEAKLAIQKNRMQSDSSSSNATAAVAATTTAATIVLPPTAANENRLSDNITTATTTTIGDNQNEETNQEGRLSQKSLNAIGLLDEAQIKIDETKQKILKYRLELITVKNSMSELPFARKDIMLTQLEVDALQLSHLDSITSSDLNSGKQEIVTRRRELNAMVDALSTDIQNLLISFDTKETELAAAS